MDGWSVELSHEDGWDFAQIASVNTRSSLQIEADDGNGNVQFTGWRVTLDAKGLDMLIQEAINLRARLNGSRSFNGVNPAAGESAGQKV
jgi:hypothetical protein